ncbi:MAG: ABC transporter permease [Burkholderiaceae bacterium]
MNRFADAVLAFIAAVALWQAIVWLTGVPHYILPGPGRVAIALVDNAELISHHAVITIAEVLIGILLGTALGVLTALHLMQSPLARRFVLPVMVFSQAVPVFALAPLLTLWFGYGIWSKIVMAMLIIYFPVAATFYDGLRRTNPGLLDLATTMGADGLSTLFRIRVPAALPSLASGLRLAAVYAPIGAVIGEWVGASRGLGYLMLLANGRVKIDLMFAALFVLALFTVILHAGVSVLSKRMTRWSGTSEDDE